MPDTQTQSDLSSIKRDLSSLRGDLEDIVEQVLDNSRARGSAFKEKVAEVGRKVATPAQNTIRERPLVSVVVMLFVGLVLGTVLGKLVDLRRG